MKKYVLPLFMFLAAFSSLSLQRHPTFWDSMTVLSFCRPPNALLS